MFLGLIVLATVDVVAVTWNSQFVLALVGLALPGTALAYRLWYVILKQMGPLVPTYSVSQGRLYPI